MYSWVSTLYLGGWGGGVGGGGKDLLKIIHDICMPSVPNVLTAVVIKECRLSILKKILLEL